jgi:hypothetical protein
VSGEGPDWLDVMVHDRVRGTLDGVAPRHGEIQTSERSTKEAQESSSLSVPRVRPVSLAKRSAMAQ